MIPMHSLSLPSSESMQNLETSSSEDGWGVGDKTGLGLGLCVGSCVPWNDGEAVGCHASDGISVGSAVGTEVG